MLPSFVILVSQSATALKSHPYTSTKDNSHEITSLRQNTGGRGLSGLQTRLSIRSERRTCNAPTCNRQIRISQRSNNFRASNSHAVPSHQPARSPLPSLLPHSQFGTVPPSRPPARKT